MCPVASLFFMNREQFLIWNARGLNSRARRTAVRDIISLERTSVIAPQETKVAAFSVSMISELLGPDFDYSCLPSVGVSGGVLVGWRTDTWLASHPSIGTFSVTLHLAPVGRPAEDGCWLTTVYGPNGSLAQGSVPL